MIIDLQKFIAGERRYWEELEAVLDDLANTPGKRLDLAGITRFHALYERVSADLARLATFGIEREMRGYLEALVARAYGEIHESRRVQRRFNPLHWFLRTFPRTFRRRAAAFRLALAATLAGCLFGSLVVVLDPEAKQALLPYPQLMENPSARVAREEQTLRDRLEGVKARGAAWYMTHNTRVAIYTMAMGATWGIGTLALLFYNGIMLGVVAADYVVAGHARFLVGWLLPHGSIEIPAIVLAGQAGFVLAGAMIGRKRRAPLGVRLRETGGDLVTLIAGVSILLVWAGIVEAFLSQYHEPILPYSFKIAFGGVEFALLALLLTRSGRKTT